MRTSSRLFAMALTCAGLFALSWFLFVRERPQQQAVEPPKVKTTQELLVGTWRIVEQDPPLASNLSVTSEFTANGKEIIRIVASGHGPLPVIEGAYKVEGDVIHFDVQEGSNNQFHSWKARIERATDDSLILVGFQQDTTRVVYAREK